MASIAIDLEVDDTGSVVVRRFTNETVDRVKHMSNKSIGHVKRLATKFTRGLGGAISGVGRTLMNLKTLAVGALAGWGLTKALGEFATFESALVDMGKVTDESFESIKKKMMDLPSSLGSATEMVKGYYQVISAGVKGAANQMETLITTSKLAKTAHADQAQVVAGLTSIMDAFGATAGTAADAMQTMEKTGKTTVSALIPVIGQLSSGASALGLSLDEMGAAFAVVTTQSGGTEKAATQLKAIMTSLMSPTKEMSELLEGYGGAQAAIKQIGFGGVMKLIAEATGGNVEKTKKLMGASEALLGVLSILSGKMQTYNQNLEEQKNKTGALDKAWEDYQKTLNAIWDTIKNTIGKQVILIGEELAPAIKKVITAVSDWLAKNRELITSKFEGWIKGLLGGIANLIESIAGFVASLSGLKKIVHGSISFLAAMGATVVDVAAAFCLLDPINAFKAAIYGIRETFPALAELGDRFDSVGISQAKAALKVENSQKKYAGYAESMRGVSASIRKLIAEEGTAVESSKTLSELHDETVKRMEANAKSAATNMITATKSASNQMVIEWKDKIVLIDGVYTDIKEKVEVPAKIAIEDKATTALQAIQTQGEITQKTLSKNISVAIDDKATSVLHKIQAEMAKIRSKTVYVKVVHTGTGSTELPLTEKIREIQRMYGQIPTQMSFNADFSSYIGGLTSLAETIHSLNYKAASFVRGRWHFVGEEAKEMAESLSRVFSEAVSRGTAGPALAPGRGVSIGEININITGAQAPQTPEDWRLIVRQYIKPELERLRYA